MKKFEYGDIINAPRPKAKNPMPVSNRAAQFMPFAALSGYGEALNETGRITQEKRVPDQDRLNSINTELEKLYKNQNKRPLANIEYFEKDEKKSGGRYEKLIERIKCVEPTKQYLVLENGKKIDFENIYFIFEEK